MKRKVIISALIILVAVAASLGATMAWFTASTAPIENVFEAGTVGISADEKVSWSDADFADSQATRMNWNPGDCDWKLFRITNDDSKGIYLRASFTGKWEAITGDVTNANGDELAWWLNQNVTVISYDDAGLSAPAWDFISYNPVAPSTPYNQGVWVVVDNAGDKEWFTAYYYFKGSVPGTFDAPDANVGETNPARQVLLFVKVCVDGPDTGNEYQDKLFKLSGTFEAIQRSHEAAFEEWNAGYHAGQWYPVVAETNKANGTIYFDTGAGEWKLQLSDTETLTWAVSPAPNTNPNVKSFQ
jgi:hypothetical protein